MLYWEHIKSVCRDMQILLSRISHALHKACFPASDFFVWEQNSHTMKMEILELLIHSQKLVLLTPVGNLKYRL